MPDPVDVSEEALQALGRATNEFGADLYARLPRQGNAVMSPASIHLALSMTSAGARGETANEMTAVLKTEDLSQHHQASAAVLRSLNDPAISDFELRVVNRLFGERTFTFEPAYLELTRASYGAPLEGLSFRTDFEGARGRINGWVANRTNDRIRDLLPPGAVDAAVYAPDSYTASRALGMQLRAQGSRGVIYHSVRDEGGRCVGLFSPCGASGCLHAAYLIYVWNGSEFSGIYEQVA